MHSKVQTPAGGLLFLWVSLCWLWALPATAPGQTTTTTATTQATSLPATSTSPASQPSISPTDATGEALSLNILPPPTDDESIQERLALVDSRLAELAQSVPTASAPASQPDDQAARTPAQRLHDALLLYRSELVRWQATRQKIKELKSAEVIEGLSKTLADWKERRQFYEKLQGESLRNATQEHIDAVQREYRQLDSRLADLTAAQTAIEQQRGSLTQTKEAAEASTAASLDELKKFVAALPGRLDEAATPAQREVLFQRKRALEWAHNLQLLRAAASADLRASLALQNEQNAAQIEVLAGYVKSLREYRNRLEKARSQTAAEYAAEQLAHPGLPPWKATFWETVLHASEGLNYFQSLDDPTRNRFPPSEAEQLEQRLMRGRTYWQGFMESIERRPGSVINGAYRRITTRIAADKDILKSYQQKLDQTLDEQRTAMDRQSILVSRSYALTRQFAEQIERLEGDDLVEARKLQARLTGEIQADLTQKTQAIISEQQATAERLTKAIAQLNEYVELLSRYRSTMYWARLFVGGPGLFDHDWKAVFATLREAASGEGLVGEAWRRYWQSTWAEFKAIPSRRAIMALALTLGALTLGLGSRHRLLRQARTEERAWLAGAGEPPADFRLPLRDRFRIELTAAAGRMMPVILPLFTLLVLAVYFLGRGTEAFALIATVVFWLAGTRIALAWININFASRRPATRLIPCADAVAAHHQRWLRLLVLLALLLLPVPVFFGRAGLLPEVTSILLAVALTALLLVCFLYVLRRDSFVGRPDATGGSSWRTLLRTTLPVLSASVVVLIALAGGGYQDLAFYVLTGVAWSVCVIWMALVLWMLLHSASKEGKQQLDKALAAGDSAEVALDPEKTHPLMLVGLQLGSLSVVVLGVMVLLYGWGISPFEIKLLLNYPLGTLGGGPVQLWRPFAAAAAIAGAVIVSRTVRAFLQTKVFPQAVNLTRGGQAAVLTILNYAIVAMGGYAALVLMNLRLGALAVLLGTLGLGLGLGLQPLFVNFISGLLILFERQIKVGDTIMVQDQVGEVTAISTRSTKIRTGDNIELDIPNAEFVTNKVVNWTMPDKRLRGQVEVIVGYESDERLVHRLLLEIAQRNPLVLPDPPPDVWFLDFGDNGLKFSLVCWFANPSTRWRFLTTVRFEIRDVFRKHGIEMPFPQRTISMLGNRPILVQMVQNGAPGLPPGPAEVGCVEDRADQSSPRG
ncbi:MAG TPA: mechanosensitive ion channel [Phycisphaerae bacterium]|jgi:small-conductance mechanosensitive channel|nr:mechanosensitive ion channel [Phycisphaerae bacterium]HOJ56857.1 mechanosensitive ion channel [Phycisphaerae bacterium]HOL28585.1 mechanosensitive ion channel [Phycisphaerae bacterium]HPP22661.1 mechanosensitive ion channel [Phycisphaerae bacterium]HPU35119.1 mechanosensitive ion channel [Phycisphaerae bacterium]